MTSDGSPIPIILLKTESAPKDAYEEYFKAAGNFTPSFAPVLEHKFRKEALAEIAAIYRSGDLGFSPKPDGSTPKYGGIIFTSQRAVDAFGQVISTLRIYGATNDLMPQDIVFYVVGPATAKGVRALDLPTEIAGEESGNGDALASFVLDNYNHKFTAQTALSTKPRLLFLVGEQRRDIIPKTLQNPSLDLSKQIGVDELIVYETTEMKSFKADFAEKYLKGVVDGSAHQWVVVFSPTGCRAMLESLGLLDAETGRFKDKPRRPYVATIGPTTRSYLSREFGFEPDVCSETPTPEGLGSGIAAFVASMKKPASSTIPPGGA